MIDRFFGFLNCPPESSGADGLNSTLCGYFCKVVLILAQTEPKEFYSYISANDFELLSRITAHLDNKSVCEMFIKVFNLVIAQSGVKEQSSIVNMVQQPNTFAL